MDRHGLNLGAMSNMSGGYKTRNSNNSDVLARIIVVDDEDFIRDLYRDMFESKGHTVYSARNGDEAIRYLKTMSVRPDAIIMDHRMPGKDGIQTTKEILSIDPNIPIIFSSADEEARTEAIKAGATSFWAKPFPIRMLIDATVDVVKARRR